MGFWKKLRLGMILAVRIKALKAIVEDPRTQDHMKRVAAEDPIMAPLLHEAQAIVEDARRVL